jgi:hypothetical protein
MTATRPMLILICLGALGFITGCTQGTLGSSSPIAATPVTPLPAPAPSYQAWHCAIAVSGGFNRNNAWGASCGTHLQGAINTANANCRPYSSSGGCDDVFWCSSPDLTPSTPWIAFYRTSVFVDSYISRGAHGISCGHPSEAAARAEAASLCRIHNCQFVWAGRAYS